MIFLGQIRWLFYTKEENEKKVKMKKNVQWIRENFVVIIFLNHKN